MSNTIADYQSTVNFRIAVYDSRPFIPEIPSTMFNIYAQHSKNCADLKDKNCIINHDITSLNSLIAYANNSTQRTIINVVLTAITVSLIAFAIIVLLLFPPTFLAACPISIMMAMLIGGSGFPLNNIYLGSPVDEYISLHLENLREPLAHLKLLIANKDELKKNIQTEIDRKEETLTMFERQHNALRIEELQTALKELDKAIAFIKH